MRLPTSRAALRIRVSTLDFLCALGAPPLALYLSNALIWQSKDTSIIAFYWALSFTFSLAAFLVFRLHDGLSRYFSVHDTLDILKAVVVSQLLTTVALFTFNRLDGIPRSTPIYQALILAVGLVSIRTLIQALKNGTYASNGHHHAARENIIMIGATNLSLLYIKLLEAVSPGQRRVIAFLDNRPQLVGRSMAGIRILALPHHLKSVIEEFDVHGIPTDRVIVGDENNSLADDELKVIREACDQSEIKLAFVQQLIGADAAPLAIEEKSELKPIAPPKFELPLYFRVRPILDSFAALVLIVLFSPLLLFAGMLVLLDIGPPVMFWQQRIGQGGHRFLLHKFRTLRAPYDWRGRPTPDRENLSLIGRLLRQTRLDEMPQLLNVLVGDMALIGPRPLLPEDQPTNPGTRLMVRPGMTGWAQVNGGKFLTPEEKDQYDEYYIRNASPWFDARILVTTLKVLLRFSGRTDYEVAASCRVGFGKPQSSAQAKQSSARVSTIVHNGEIQSPSINLATPDGSLSALPVSNLNKSHDANHRRG
jgi:lipopolysaccharide/colanic/teichoic acid biosynthesis glycosyltransferase